MLLSHPGMVQEWIEMHAHIKIMLSKASSTTGNGITQKGDTVFSLTYSTNAHSMSTLMTIGLKNSVGHPPAQVQL